MQIRITQPDPDYPYAWITVSMMTDLESPGLSDILESRRVTLLGRWEPHMVGGKIGGFKAPVLLEDQHVKPRKRPTSAKRATKK